MIRHNRDYGFIGLFDQRWTIESNAKRMASWIRDIGMGTHSIADYARFSENLKEHFRRNELEFPQQLNPQESADEDDDLEDVDHGNMM